MNAEQEKNELIKRQVFYSSSLVIKLNAVNGKWYYSVYAWLNNQSVDSKILVLMNKYKGEYPQDIISLALKELDLKKIKIGNPIIDTPPQREART